MPDSARELLETIKLELAPAENDNRLVPLVESGQAPRSVFTTLAAEELRIVASDWRSFLTLASRSTDPLAREFFSWLAQGEGVALDRLRALAAAVGLDDAAAREYQPRAGCQAYPAYVAWLALNGEPVDVVVALVANFAAWGGYCARTAAAMRAHYGFDDDACGFFDLFAMPAPEVDELAESAVQASVDAGRLTGEARLYGRLFKSYELMFWNTAAEPA
jgi:TENA/THI-4/PQQC family